MLTTAVDLSTMWVELLSFRFLFFCFPQFCVGIGKSWTLVSPGQKQGYFDQSLVIPRGFLFQQSTKHVFHPFSVWYM